MTRRVCWNHASAFKAMVALAAIRRCARVGGFVRCAYAVHSGLGARMPNRAFFDHLPQVAASRRFGGHHSDRATRKRHIITATAEAPFDAEANPVQ